MREKQTTHVLVPSLRTFIVRGETHRKAARMTRALSLMRRGFGSQSQRSQGRIRPTSAAENADERRWYTFGRASIRILRLRCTNGRSCCSRGELANVVRISTDDANYNSTPPRGWRFAFSDATHPQRSEGQHRRRWRAAIFPREQIALRKRRDRERFRHFSLGTVYRIFFRVRAG